MCWTSKTCVAHRSTSVRSHNICVTLPLHPYRTVFCTITNQNTYTLPPCATFTSIPSYLDQSTVTTSTFANIPPEYKCYWPVIIYQSPLCSPAFSTPCLRPLNRQHPHTQSRNTQANVASLVVHIANHINLLVIWLHHVWCLLTWWFANQHWS
jgi:hypothetical protein